MLCWWDTADEETVTVREAHWGNGSEPKVINCCGFSEAAGCCSPVLGNESGPLLQMWEGESVSLLQMWERITQWPPLQGKINSFDLGFLTCLRVEQQAKRDLPVSACCSNANMLYFRRACPEPHVTRQDRKEARDWGLLSRHVHKIKFKLHMNLYFHLAQIYMQGARTPLEGKEAGYKRMQKTQR